MALLKPGQVYKNSETFSGYWALGPIGINPMSRTITVQLGLYWDLASYIANPQDNCMSLTDTYTFKEPIYSQLLPDNVPVENSPQLAVILYSIFAMIKAQLNEDGTPGFFNDAEIVP